MLYASGLLVLAYRPQPLGLAFPAFDLPCPDLDEVAPYLHPAFHADEDPLEQPVFSFRELVL